MDIPSIHHKHSPRLHRERDMFDDIMDLVHFEVCEPQVVVMSKVVVIPKGACRDMARVDLQPKITTTSAKKMIKIQHFPVQN